jgi:hypothetical protein
MCRSREMVHSSEIQGCNLLEYGICVLYIRLHCIGIVSWSVPQIKPITHSLTQPSYHAFKKNKTNDWVFSKRMKRMTCVRIASYCIIHQSYWLLVLGWRWLGRILLISNPPRWSSIELNIFIGAKFTASSILHLRGNTTQTNVKGGGLTGRYKLYVMEIDAFITNCNKVWIAILLQQVRIL